MFNHGTFQSPVKTLIFTSSFQRRHDGDYPSKGLILISLHGNHSSFIPGCGQNQAEGDLSNLTSASYQISGRTQIRIQDPNLMF